MRFWNTGTGTGLGKAGSTDLTPDLLAWWLLSTASRGCSGCPRDSRARIHPVAASSKAGRCRKQNVSLPQNRGVCFESLHLRFQSQLTSSWLQFQQNTCSQSCGIFKLGKPQWLLTHFSGWRRDGLKQFLGSIVELKPGVRRSWGQISSEKIQRK